uniref:Uncharacterized protein n=1 Tax=Macrostomum lignano TaxID=282301 RepID=A0A1I8FFS8_9PLAT
MHCGPCSVHQIQEGNLTQCRECTTDLCNDKFAKELVPELPNLIMCYNSRDFEEEKIIHPTGEALTLVDCGDDCEKLGWKMCRRCYSHMCNDRGDYWNYGDPDAKPRPFIQDRKLLSDEVVSVSSPVTRPTGLVRVSLSCTGPRINFPDYAWPRPQSNQLAGQPHGRLSRRLPSPAIVGGGHRASRRAGLVDTRRDRPPSGAALALARPRTDFRDAARRLADADHGEDRDAGRRRLLVDVVDEVPAAAAAAAAAEVDAVLVLLLLLLVADIAAALANRLIASRPVSVRVARIEAGSTRGCGASALGQTHQRSVNNVRFNLSLMTRRRRRDTGRGWRIKSGHFGDDGFVDKTGATFGGCCSGGCCSSGLGWHGNQRYWHIYTKSTGPLKARRTFKIAAPLSTELSHSRRGLPRRRLLLLHRPDANVAAKTAR